MPHFAGVTVIAIIAPALAAGIAHVLFMCVERPPRAAAAGHAHGDSRPDQGANRRAVP